MGLQRVGHDRATELNWKPPPAPVPNLLMPLCSSPVTSHPFPVPSVSIFLLPISLSTDNWLCPAWLKSPLTSHLCSSYWTGWLHLTHKITLSLKLIWFLSQRFLGTSWICCELLFLSSSSSFFFFILFWLCHVASWFPDQGLKPCLLQWKHGVLTTEPSGKSLTIF